jgi:membrane protease YdiL (CAAX protease family)
MTADKAQPRQFTGTLGAPGPPAEHFAGPGAGSTGARTQGILRHLLLTVLAVAATALAGVVFCWLRLCARSLAAPAMLHLAGNSLAYLLAWIVLRSTP